MSENTLSGAVGLALVVSFIGYQGYLNYFASVKHGTPYVVNEGVKASTEVDFGAKVGFSIDRSHFRNLPKGTWASGPVRGWKRVEWLLYGGATSRDDIIAIIVAHRTRGNKVRKNLRVFLADASQFDSGSLRLGNAEWTISTKVGKFETLDFKVSMEGIGKSCTGFAANEINAAVVISGYLCSANKRRPSDQKLISVLDTLESPRFAIGPKSKGVVKTVAFKLGGSLRGSMN